VHFYFALACDAQGAVNARFLQASAIAAAAAAAAAAVVVVRHRRLGETKKISLEWFNDDNYAAHEKKKKKKKKEERKKRKRTRWQEIICGRAVFVVRGARRAIEVINSADQPWRRNARVTHAV